MNRTINGDIKLCVKCLYGRGLTCRRLQKEKKRIQGFSFYLYPFTGLIKTRFKSVSRFFPDFFSSSLFYPDFTDFPIIFSNLPYFALFFSQFSYSKGGILLDAIFPPRILFSFFYSRGAWLRGKQKTYFFFSAHFHPCHLTPGWRLANVN